MDNSEKGIKSRAYIIIVVVAIVISLVFSLNLFGEKPNDIRVFGGGKTIGLKCTNTTILHPALRDYTPVSHTNTIMANFIDDTLSSITLYYVGTYSSSLEANQAEAYAQADYGLIPAKEMNINAEPFSHSFMVDGEKVSMTITAKSADIEDGAAPYFLLEQGRSFPRNLSEMKKRYEESNFSCEVAD